MYAAHYIACGFGTFRYIFYNFVLRKTHSEYLHLNLKKTLKILMVNITILIKLGFEKYKKKYAIAFFVLQK